MPDHRRMDAADWILRRTWDQVREDLGALREEGEDCRAVSVRTDAETGDEARADTHRETRGLFLPARTEDPAPSASDRPAQHRAAGMSGRLVDAIERVNAGADYHQDTERRRRWVVEWLHAGAALGARDPKGWTPLHFAAAGSWHPELVTALVDAGAAVDARNHEGWTPLHLAARYGSPEVVLALRAGGADVDARDPGGRTPLHGAAADGAPGRVAQLVAALVHAGADVDARTENRWTPLHLAAWHGSLEAVAAVRVAGADVNARNKDDWTPLHLVARCGRPKAIATALVAAGADPDGRTRDGWTPLHLAAAHGELELVEAFLAAGSDLGARNGDGSTALEVAAAHRRPREVAALRAAAARIAGRNRDRSMRHVEVPSRENAGANTRRGRLPRPGEMPPAPSPAPSGAVPAKADGAWSGWSEASGQRRVGARVGSRPAGRRPRRRWRLIGGLAVLTTVGFYWLNPGDDGPSSSPGGDNRAPDAAAAPVSADAGANTPIPPAATGAPPAADDALNLDRSARRRIQAGLSAAGFEPGPADGVFGAGTRDAIRAWQEARGVPATGYLGAVEVGELFALDPGEREAVGAERGGGRLTVRAAPGSLVELDGNDVGVTGATGLLVLSEVQPGRHVVVARKEGHTEATLVVEVLEGRAEVVELALTAAPGTLTVTANVTDVLLRIGDAGDHRLPLNRLELPAGSHRLTASREGFRTVGNDVEIRPGELTTLDLVLAPVPVEELLQAARGRFAAGSYGEAAERARAVLSMRPDAGAGHLVLGRALYELGEFDASINPLGRAILRGQEVVLPTRHRHGGGGIREGFCSGTITLSRNELAFVSGEQPEHGFSVTPDKMTSMAVTQSIGGSAFRLNTSVQDEDRGIRRRNFDFVHRNATRAREEPDSPVIVLICPDCEGSLNVQAALMNYVSRLAR